MILFFRELECSSTLIPKHDGNIDQESVEKVFSTLCKIPQYVFIICTFVGMDPVGTSLVLCKFSCLDLLPMFPPLPMFA